MQKLILYIKRKIFLIEYLIFFLTSFIGTGLVNRYFFARLTFVAVLSLLHFVFKFFVYKYLRVLDLKPLTSMIIAFISTTHFFTPILTIILMFGWVENWKIDYRRHEIIICFFIPGYLALFTTILLYLKNKEKNTIISDNIKTP